ncbi:MAG: metallophosphoesterase, partial [Defluviitaleaceae bacterium]|nr:metallophosphoesterase [Defluviitaleaceae bacterium]
MGSKQRAVHPARRVLAMVVAFIMAFGLAADMLALWVNAAEASPAVIMPASAAAGSHYRNLSLNPGANNAEMRFTWHSGSPTGSIIIRTVEATYHEVIFDANNGTIVPPALPMAAQAEQALWVLESVSTQRVEAQFGIGAMGANARVYPTRPGFTYYLHQVSVYNLPYDTTFEYWVTWNGGESSRKTFRTGGADSFRFLIAGDPQIGTGDGLNPQGTGEATRDGREWTSALDIALSAAPDAGFVLAVGDQVHSSNHTPGVNHVTISQYRHDRMFSPQALHSLPIMGVVGNHDGWSFNNDNANPRLWPMHYNIPVPDGVGEIGGYNYNVFRHRNQFYTQFDYWVRWGNTLFFVIDSNGGNTTPERTMTGERLRFLENAVAQNSDAQWLVATFHHPAFCVYRVSHAEEKTQVINHFLPHLERLSFDVILTGHAHVYNRTHQMIGTQPQLTQNWLTANGRVQRGTNATNAVLDPTGIVHFTFNSASGSGFYNVTFMPRSYIAVYNQNFRRNFSVAEVTEHTFSIRTYQINNDNSYTLVDVYTIVRGENGAVPAAVTSLPQMNEQIFERITVPTATTIAHGTPATATDFGLPTYVGIETNLFNNVGGNVANVRPPNAAAAPGSYGLVVRTPQARVVWDLANSGYRIDYAGRQNLRVRGTVQGLPTGISNPRNIALTVYANVTVLRYGEVLPGVIAQWMAYGRPNPNPNNLPPEPGGLDYYFWSINTNGGNVRVAALQPTYGYGVGALAPIRFFSGNEQRYFNWNSGAPTITTGVVNDAAGAMGVGTLTDPARWETTISTTGRAGIVVEFEFRSDSTAGTDRGPRDWQLQYSVGDTGIWNNADTPIVLTGVWNTLTRTLPATANNHDVLHLRWLNTGNYAVGGGTTIHPTARNHMRNINIRSTRSYLDGDDGGDYAQRIDILMFNDFHGHVEAQQPIPEIPGAARLVSYIEYQRNQNPDPRNVVVVAGGDEFHGFAVSTIQQGNPTLEMMGYLARNSYAQTTFPVALGNHEFSFGFNRGVEFGRDSRISLMAADLFYGPNHPLAGERPDFVEAYQILTFPDGISVALVGLMASTMSRSVSGWGALQLHARTPAPNAPDAYTQAIATLINDLRSVHGVSAVIGVTHKPAGSASMTYIANNLDFDAIVGGHLHVRAQREVNGVPIIEAEAHGRSLGRFSLLFDANDNLLGVESWLSPVGEIAAFDRDAAQRAGVAHHYDYVTNFIQPHLNTTYSELRGPRGPHGVYFGNRAERDVWVSRLVLDYVTRWAHARNERTDNIIGISNSGGWRNTGFWPRNANDQTTFMELLTTMPFDNNVLLFEMTGRDVLRKFGATTITAGNQVRAGVHQVGNYWYVTASEERILYCVDQRFTVIGSNFTFGGIDQSGGDGFPWPGNFQGGNLGMQVLSPPRVVMQGGGYITWQQLIAQSDSSADWEGLGVTMIRNALLESTDFRQQTSNNLWQAELTVSAGVNGTAVIASPFAPDNRTRNTNIAPQWVTVQARPPAGHITQWFNVGDLMDATPLHEGNMFSFVIRANTQLEARFVIHDVPLPDPITVEEARATAVGETITVSGVVTGVYHPGNDGVGLFIQSPSGTTADSGILIRVAGTGAANANANLAAVNALNLLGNVVDFTGVRTLGVAGNGFIGIDYILVADTTIASMRIIEPAIMPTPIAVSLADLRAGAYRSMLVSIIEDVQISGFTTGAGGDPNRLLAHTDGTRLAFDAGGNIVPHPGTNNAGNPASFIVWPDPGASSVGNYYRVNSAVVHWWSARNEVQLRGVGNDAIHVVPPCFRTLLGEKITTAQTRTQADYTVASWSDFATALGNAQATYADANATDNALQTALEALITAYGALELYVVPPAAALPVAWASEDLNTRYGFPAITGNISFNPRWDVSLGLASDPSTARLNFMANGVARVLTAVSGGINAGNNLVRGDYWITEVSTLGQTNIRVDWSIRSTNTGPRDWQLEYSIDGTVWNYVDVPVVVVNASGTNPANVNVASHFYSMLPTTAEEQPNLRLRWLIISNASVENNTIATGGTTQIGNIHIRAVDPLTVNKAALRAKLDNAEVRSQTNAYTSVYTTYTTGSWAAFEIARGNAQTVYNNADATQAAVNETLAALTTAYAELTNTIAFARFAPIGTRVTVEGVVTGTVGAGLAVMQYIDASVDTPNAGITVQMISNAAFIGQLIRVAGYARDIQGNRRVTLINDNATGDTNRIPNAGVQVMNANPVSNIAPIPITLDMAETGFQSMQISVLTPSTIGVRNALLTAQNHTLVGSTVELRAALGAPAALNDMVQNGTQIIINRGVVLNFNATRQIYSATANEGEFIRLTGINNANRIAIYTPTLQLPLFALPPLAPEKDDDYYDDDYYNDYDYTYDDKDDKDYDYYHDDDYDYCDDYCYDYDYDYCDDYCYDYDYDYCDYYYNYYCTYTPYPPADVVISAGLRLVPNRFILSGVGAGLSDGLLAVSQGIQPFTAATQTQFSVHVQDGSTVGALIPTATRQGYRFLGWNTARDGSGTAFTAATVITANIRVFAQWESTAPSGTPPSTPPTTPPVTTPPSDTPAPAPPASSAAAPTPSPAPVVT